MTDKNEMLFSEPKVEKESDTDNYSTNRPPILQKGSSASGEGKFLPDPDPMSRHFESSTRLYSDYGIWP